MTAIETVTGTVTTGVVVETAAAAVAAAIVAEGGAMGETATDGARTPIRMEKKRAGGGDRQEAMVGGATGKHVTLQTVTATVATVAGRAGTGMATALPPAAVAPEASARGALEGGRFRERGIEAGVGAEVGARSAAARARGRGGRRPLRPGEKRLFDQY